MQMKRPSRLRIGMVYVSVFVTLHEVVYFYAETREGDLPRERLKGFGGVLVSDFYTAYDLLSGEKDIDAFANQR
jgi:hypothetical protein